MLQKSSKMAICRNRIRPREETFKLLFCRSLTQFRQLLQEKQQISKWIKPITLGCLNHTETQCTGISTLGSVAEQEILPGHNKGFYSAFCNIVCQSQASIHENAFLCLPLVQRVRSRFSEVGVFVLFKAVYRESTGLRYPQQSGRDRSAACK